MCPEALLSELVVSTKATDLPEAVIQATARQVFDGIGVTLAASVQPAGDIIKAVTTETGGNSHARLIGSGIRTSVAQAGWANGSLAHLLDFDDTGFSHPTACLLPVALAVGEMVDAPGLEVIGALVLGYEVFERLAVASRPYEPVIRRRGWHPSPLWGSPAALLAARPRAI